jgi:hypothetical protein
MDRFALVVMSESGEEHPGGQGRMLHALTAAADFRKAGTEARIFFHGIGVLWLPAFETPTDRFCEHYGPLFESVRDMIGGACNFCAATRFGAGDAAQRMGVPLLGEPGGHHTVGTLAVEGYQPIVF